jgi:hypothetical protein
VAVEPETAGQIEEEESNSGILRLWTRLSQMEEREKRIEDMLVQILKSQKARM